MAVEILTAKTTAENAETGPMTEETARRAAVLLDGLEPGEYSVEGRRVRVVVLDEDRDDTPSLLASAGHRIHEWEPEYLATASPAVSGGRIPASMAVGALAAIGMLGMLAGVLSLPRTGGLESMAIVRPAPEFESEELPVITTEEPVAKIAGVTAVASAR